MSPPSEQTILITGANGYVASHIVKAALDKGYHVRGTVRSQSSADKTKALFASYGDRLTTAIVPDITSADAYKAGFEAPTKPITAVFNVAAPFILDVEDNVKQLLDPAINSVTAILEATRRYGPNVGRVVNTSSFASILDLGQGARPGYVYTEKDWNPMTFDQAAATSDGATAYCASKALAERAAWDWVKEHEPSFTLTALCPPWVFGPHVTRPADVSKLNESSAAIWALVGASEVPPLDFGGFVDVRDIAAAHVLALESPDAAGQRFLVGSPFDYQSAIDALRAELPQIRDRLPLGNPGAGATADVYKPDGSLATKVLGIKYTPLKDTMRDTVQQLLETEAAA
jgi:nucleoside-diphosphate-sugar epimerase